MFVCNGGLSFRCNTLKIDIVGVMQCIRFDIVAAVSPNEIKNLFANEAFYFYDETLGGRLPAQDDSEITSVRISYNEDLSCKIEIELLKKDGIKLCESNLLTVQ